MAAMGRRSLVLVVLLAACASHKKLTPLAQIPHLKELADRSAALPNERGHVTIDGIKLGYRLTKNGSKDRTIVLVHGLLSDARAWRFVLGDLGTDHRVLLIDLMGCGTSDKPGLDDVDETGYTPEGMGRQVLQMIRAKTTGRITVAGHSLGGTVILRILGSPKLREEYADVLNRIDRAVLMSAVDFAIERRHEIFERVVDTPDFVVTIGSWLGIVKELTAQAIFEATKDTQRVPREEAMNMVERLSNSETRHPAQAMILRAVPYTKDRRPDWPAIERLVNEYKNITTKTLVIWGARDETFPSSMGYKLATQIPDAWLHVVPRRMHQLPGEAPVECARLIREFTANGGKGRPRYVD